MTSMTDNSGRRYDVVIIGAGPAGCEASLAAAGSGARALCLTMNLDTIGYHPANPILVEDSKDPRGRLLEELELLEGWLPTLLAREEVSHIEDGGRLVADRRELGLAYKEVLENCEGLQMRQSLVTSLEKTEEGWLVRTSHAEEFPSRTVVIAAGTFLEGEVRMGGVTVPGGRPGEIPSAALSRCLQGLGYSFTRITATNSPRIPAGAGCNPPRSQGTFPRDGSQLSELYAYGFYPSGGTGEQLFELRAAFDDNAAWINRLAHSVSHLVFDGGQLGKDLLLSGGPGLFAAGKVAGSCNYIEAATLGLLAGNNASSSAADRNNLIISQKVVSKLLTLISGTRERPVTIRIEGPGC